MNEEKTGNCLRKVEHIHGHLWHIYSIAVNQFMMATVKLYRACDNVQIYLVEGYC
jgi:hypothetical protein